MHNGFNLDGLLTDLAKRVAAEVRADLEQHGSGTAIHPRLLTVEQAASYLGRSKNAVEHMVACGKIPRVKSDRRVFLDVRDLDEWIQDNKERAI